MSSQRFVVVDLVYVIANCIYESKDRLCKQTPRITRAGDLFVVECISWSPVGNVVFLTCACGVCVLCVWGVWVCVLCLHMFMCVCVVVCLCGCEFICECVIIDLWVCL